MTQESLQREQRRKAHHGGRAANAHTDLALRFKQAGLAEQRRIAIREEVTRLRAGGTPTPRPLHHAEPASRWERLQEGLPRWTFESAFWVGGAAVVAVVWATRGILSSLAIPLTAVAFAARYKYLDSPAVRLAPPRTTRRRSDEQRLVKH